MRYPVDFSLFERDSHNPSFFSIARSMGDRAGELVDFCVPCNPYFPSEAMLGSLTKEIARTLRFYPSDRSVIEKELCSFLELSPEAVTLANGSTELITWIDHLLLKESLITPVPTFGRWTDQPAETGKKVFYYQLYEKNKFQFEVDDFIEATLKSGARAVAVCNPNNPTGGYILKRDVLRMLDAFEALDLIVVDESFIDFVDRESHPSVAQEASARHNVIVLKSLGKNFGLHGIRFGYSVSNPRLTEKLRRAMPPWNINSVAEAVIFMIGHHYQEYVESLKKIQADRAFMEDEMSRLGLSIYPSQANFLLIKLPEALNAHGARDYLLSEHGCFIRECSNKIGMGEGFLRAATHPIEDVLRLSRGIQQLLQKEDIGSSKKAISSGVDSLPKMALR